MNDNEAIDALIKVMSEMTGRIDSIEDRHNEIIASLQMAVARDHAELVALKFVLASILEQIPLDKGAFQEASTRHYDALVEVMDRGGAFSEPAQKLVRERFDHLVEVVLRVI